MKTSVIITNYNYGRYIGDAISSVLKQTQAVDQLIVVDDGSTDESKDVIEEFVAKESEILPIYTENRGQINAYNLAVNAASGDILFFLDADDVFGENHVKDALEVLKKDQYIEYITTGSKEIGMSNRLQLRYNHSKSLGYSAIATYFGLDWAACDMKSSFHTHWIGDAAGSTSVLRRTLVNRIFPLPREWSYFSNGHADAALVLGASILNAKAYYIAKPQVFIRKHADSHSIECHRSDDFKYREKLLLTKMVHYFWQKTSLPETIIRDAAYEFATIEKPSKKDLKHYRNLILRSNLSFRLKIKIILQLRHFYRKMNTISRFRMPI